MRVTSLEQGLMDVITTQEQDPQEDFPQTWESERGGGERRMSPTDALGSDHPDWGSFSCIVEERQ